MLKKLVVPHLLLLCCSAFLPTSLQAKDQALLIGIGEFVDKEIPRLPGIDLDLNTMELTARRLGFSKDSIRRLQDEQATLEEVRKAFKKLATVTKKDRVLIYFSGHGSNIPDHTGDEQDQLDEVLVMQDTQIIDNNVDQDETLVNALVDDELRKLLKAIPARQIWVFLDACHSGTASKGAIRGILGQDEKIYIKSLVYKGMPVSKSKSKQIMVMPANRAGQEDAHFVMLAAADDDESAVATPKGSLFTLAIKTSIEKALAEKQDLRFDELREQVDSFIMQANTKNAPFHPQLTGQADAAQQLIVQSNQTTLPVVTPLQHDIQQAFSANANQALAIRSSKQDYQIGFDTLKFEVDLPKAGYLNIVQIDPNDQATVLYPNAYTQGKKNQFPAGTLKFPEPDMSFKLTISEPVGKYQIFALLTQEPLDLYALGFNQRADAAIEKWNEYRQLSALGLKQIQVRQSGKWSGSLNYSTRQ